MSSNMTALSIDNCTEPVTPPANAKTAMPAANPAVTPEMLSSMTANGLAVSPSSLEHAEDVRSRFSLEIVVDAEDSPFEPVKSPVRPKVKRILCGFRSMQRSLASGSDRGSRHSHGTL